MHSSCWNLVGPKFRRALYLGNPVDAHQPVSCICSKLFLAPKTDPLIPACMSESWHPFICCHSFFYRVCFKRRKFYSIVSFKNSYHKRNAVGNSKSYLGLFKEYEGRTGRRERVLRAIWESFINGVVAQSCAIQALPMLKYCCEGEWERH